jgi:hypothetical protein
MILAVCFLTAALVEISPVVIDESRPPGFGFGSILIMARNRRPRAAKVIPLPPRPEAPHALRDRLATMRDRFFERLPAEHRQAYRDIRAIEDQVAAGEGGHHPRSVSLALEWMRFCDEPPDWKAPTRRDRRVGDRRSDAS